MDKYENLGVVGEGSYGIVSKVKHKPTNRIVAIKKFIESEDDKNVRKIALREVRALRKLKHDNLVALLEVFRRKKRLYLVFEYVDRTVLDELERSPNGLSETFTCKIIYQVLAGTEYMHSVNYIHRDIKPENILISKAGVVKICDFGFARSLLRDGSANGKLVGSNRVQCTDYVATRWYRAPELLVGDLYYSQTVDIWAIGCLTAELSNSLPLFPGKSDLDQLHLIMTSCGELCDVHQSIFEKSSSFKKFAKILPRYKIGSVPLERTLKTTTVDLIAFIKSCLRMDPAMRMSCRDLLDKSACFLRPVFQQKTLPDLMGRIAKESNDRQPQLRSASSVTPSQSGGSKSDSRLSRQQSRHQQRGMTKNPASLSDLKDVKNQGGVKIHPAPMGTNVESYTHFPKLAKNQGTIPKKKLKPKTKQSGAKNEAPNKSSQSTKKSSSSIEEKQQSQLPPIHCVE